MAKDIKEKFLLDPVSCPFCESMNWVAGEPNYSKKKCLVENVCKDCGKEWVEEWQLVDAWEKTEA